MHALVSDSGRFHCWNHRYATVYQRKPGTQSHIFTQTGSEQQLSSLQGEGRLSGGVTQFPPDTSASPSSLQRSTDVRISDNRQKLLPTHQPISREKQTQIPNRCQVLPPIAFTLFSYAILYRFFVLCLPRISWCLSKHTFCNYQSEGFKIMCNLQKHFCSISNNLIQISWLTEVTLHILILVPSIFL